MKFIILSSFVVLCSALPALFTGKNITVNEDGSVDIQTPYGKRITVTKNLDSTGRKNVEIVVSGPQMPTKIIKIDDRPGGDVNVLEDSSDPRYKRSSKNLDQGEVLISILKQYQGNIDDITFQRLLKRIEKCVEKGEIDSVVYDLLQQLDSPYNSLKNLQQRVFEQQVGNPFAQNIGLKQDIMGRNPYENNAVIRSLQGQRLGDAVANLIFQQNPGQLQQQLQQEVLEQQLQRQQQQQQVALEILRQQRGLGRIAPVEALVENAVAQELQQDFDEQLVKEVMKQQIEKNIRQQLTGQTSSLRQELEDLVGDTQNPITTRLAEKEVLKQILTGQNPLSWDVQRQNQWFGTPNKVVGDNIITDLLRRKQVKDLQNELWKNEVAEEALQELREQRVQDILDQVRFGGNLGFGQQRRVSIDQLRGQPSQGFGQSRNLLVVKGEDLVNALREITTVPLESVYRGPTGRVGQKYIGY